jgi:hypothetical protein
MSWGKVTKNRYVSTHLIILKAKWRFLQLGGHYPELLRMIADLQPGEIVSPPIIFDPPTTDLLTHPYWLQRCNIFLFKRPLSLFAGGLKRKMFSLNGHCATKWVGQKMHLGWVSF